MGVCYWQDAVRSRRAKMAVTVRERSVYVHPATTARNVNKVCLHYMWPQQITCTIRSRPTQE